MNEAMTIAVPDLDEADLKRRLLARAGVAAGLIAVLLAGLAVHDHLNPVAAPPAAAPASGSQATMAPVGSAPIAPDLRQDPASEPEHTGAPEMATPGKREADPRESRPGSPRLVPGGEPAAAQPGQPPAGKHGETPPLAMKGYLVQLGVFASLDNAEALRTRLEGLGIPARLESRVVVGPFPDQAAARAAQTRLREAGQDAGLIVPPRR